jgi:hypothetical protein
MTPLEAFLPPTNIIDYHRDKIGWRALQVRPVPSVDSYEP